MKIKPILITLIISCSTASAQKLPNIQQGNLYAPADVKIDGKADEWGNLKAYNKSAEIYYTVANNSDQLFVVIKATDKLIIEKIVTGGIAFAVNTSNDKKDRNGAIITFPTYRKNTGEPYTMMWAIRGLKEIRKTAPSEFDSLQRNLNEKLRSEFKFIGISGISDIIDERIPIYNTEGILTAAMFDNNLSYTFEMAIPLKLLNIKTNVHPLAYNIQLNGIAFYGSEVKDLGRVLAFVGGDGYNYRTDDTSPSSWGLVTPTSFWGEYTLAK